MKILSILTFILLLNISAFSQSEWPIFRGNQQLTASVSTDLSLPMELLASFQTDDEIKASPVVKDGIIYCGSTDGNMYAIDFNGNKKWSFTADNSIEAPAILLDGKVIFGSMEGTLYCLNQLDGSLVWQYQTDAQIIGSANWTTVNGKTVVAVGSYDFYLHGVDLETGEGLWKYESANYINGAPALYKNAVAFGGCDGFLHLVNLGTGEADQMIELATYMAASPAIVDNIAYVGDYEGDMFAVNLDTGELAWSYMDEEMNLPFIASPAVSGKYIVLGNDGRSLFCYDRTNGSLIWTQRLSNRINSSSVIANDKVITPTMDGMLYVHQLETGEELWSYEVGSEMVSSPAFCDGKVVVGANDGRIYIFGSLP